MRFTPSGGRSGPGPEDWFTGAVFIDGIRNPDEQTAIGCAHVRFTPGARTAWHTHPKGQTLYVTDGIGYVATRGGRTQEIRPGDVVYIEPNERFRLPADPSRDIIMIGPGTGVAPFRGFLQERTAVGASGRHWLLFGNPHVDSDFLYQLEWQDALREGRLQRLDLAFSRDQAERIHVTHRLRENGRALYDWLERGAHLYVCGDATRMARDVHAALLDIIATHAGLDRERAAETLQLWQQQGRYARDVY